MIKDNKPNSANTRRGNNRNRNNTYYRSQVAKSGRKNNNFFEASRKRQINSYIRTLIVVAVFMIIVTIFILLGVFLHNLTAIDIDIPIGGSSMYGQNDGPAGFTATNDNLNMNNNEYANISDIFYNYRGVYLDITQLEDLEALQNFINRIKLRDINAVRIDIKRNDGVVPFRIDGHFTAVVGEYNKIALDIRDIIDTLHANEIYVSGRIACFRDHRAGTFFAGLAFREAADVVFTDSEGSRWLNIFVEDSRNYILDLVAATATLGFDEIILDYFFLPNVADASRLIYNNDDDIAKTAIVRSFIMEVRALMSEIAPQVRLGLSFPIRYFLNMPNELMGLNPTEIMHTADFFVTSFAPSHLPPNAQIGVAKPISSPYETASALSAIFADISERIMLRPDLQAFDCHDGTAIYDDAQILSQRNALFGAGINVWTLINYDNNY